MQADELISSSLTTIHPDDDGEKTLRLMEDLRVNHLAVVRNSFYLGVISEKEILSWQNTTDFVEDHIDELSSPFVLRNQHLFDIVQEIELNSLSIIPVLDEKKNYLGAITNRKLLYTIAKSTSIQSLGGMIVLQIKENDYFMSEIARIVEDNNAKILSSYITSIPQNQVIELTIKLNKIEIKSIVKDFERYDYNIIASYKSNEEDNNFLDRYESLMRFLNP